MKNLIQSVLFFEKKLSPILYIFQVVLFITPVFLLGRIIYYLLLPKAQIGGSYPYLIALYLITYYLYQVFAVIYLVIINIQFYRWKTTFINYSMNLMLITCVVCILDFAFKYITFDRFYILDANFIKPTIISLICIIVSIYLSRSKSIKLIFQTK